MKPEIKEPKAGGPEALTVSNNDDSKVSQETKQYRAKMAEEKRVALQRTEGLIESLELYYDYEIRAYWLKWNSDDYWSRVLQRDVKRLFRLKGLKAREVVWPMVTICRERGIDVLGPVKAHKARLWEDDGAKCLIADFPEQVLSEDELAELRLDRDEWYLDTDGRGATIATAILNKKWEHAIPQIAHSVTIIDAVKRGGVGWSHSSYNSYFADRKSWLKGWVKGLQRERKGGTTK